MRPRAATNVSPAKKRGSDHLDLKNGVMPLEIHQISKVKSKRVTQRAELFGECGGARQAVICVHRHPKPHTVESVKGSVEESWASPARLLKLSEGADVISSWLAGHTAPANQRDWGLPTCGARLRIIHTLLPAAPCVGEA